MNTQQLVERLERLAPLDGTPDWSDVLERASLADPPASPARRRRRFSRPRNRLVLVGAAVVVLAVAGALAPGWFGGSSQDDLLQQALAAVPTGPVLHVVLEYPQAQNGTPAGRTYDVVDVRSGHSRPVLHTLELWWDTQRHLVHAVNRVDGTSMMDELATAQGYRVLAPDGTLRSAKWPKPSVGVENLPAPLAAFFGGYKHALATHEAQGAGSGRIDGHDVEWLLFRAHATTPEEVAVDKQTFKAVAIGYPRCARCTGGRTVEVIRVMESTSRAQANFAPPVGHLHPQRRVAQYGAQKTAGTPGNASHFLHRQAYWAGSHVGAAPLSRVELSHSLDFSSGRLHPPAKDVISRGLGVTFFYGNPTSYVSIAETADTGLAFPGFNMETLSPEGQPLTAAETTLPPEGELILSHGNGGPWTAQLRKDGLQVEIEAGTRADALAAARALRPTP